MDYRSYLQASIDYIEDHIGEDLTVSQIAGRAGFSSFYFCRLFNVYVGLTVMEYVRRRRLSRAASLLIGGGRILDIALDCGFETHGGFSKAFRREFGCSPEQYRRNGRLPPGKADLFRGQSLDYIGGIKMEPRILERGSFAVAGYVLSGPSSRRSARSTPAYWEEIMPEHTESRIYQRVKVTRHGEYFLYYPQNDELTDFVYVIAGEVDDLDGVPQDMFRGMVPAATYAVFTTPPANDADGTFVKSIHDMWRYVFEQWLPESGYAYSPDGIDFEFYDERCHGGIGNVMEIHVPVVKKA